MHKKAKVDFFACFDLLVFFLPTLRTSHTSDQPRTLNCACAWCKTCQFIYNVEKISRPKRSIKITDHFTCTSANIIYCITCTLCKKLYIGETTLEVNDCTNTFLMKRKMTKMHLNQSWDTLISQIIQVCSLSLHQGSTESYKTLEQKKYFSNRQSWSSRCQRMLFHATNIYSVVVFTHCHSPTNRVAPSFSI